MSVAETVWEKVLEQLNQRLAATTVSTWFDGCRGIELNGATFIIHTPNAFKGEVIEEKFSDHITEILRNILSGEYGLRVLNDDTLETYLSAKTADRNEAENEAEDYTFERFVVGNSNRFANGAAIAVAAGSRDYNPLFIYGNTGLGKTHLLRAIRHASRQRRPDYNTVYVKGEDFMNEFIGMVQIGKGYEFRQRYRFADIFMMDDVHFIAGKERTEEEFFHTFNTLYEAGKQIILTSDQPPSGLVLLEDRLRTRFEWGLIADIQPPEYETRLAIALNKAADLGFSLTNDVADYLAETLKSNIRQLEGAVKQLHALYSINGARTITLTEAMHRIKDMIRENQSKLTPDLIISETAMYFNVTAEELKGPRRTHGTAYPRQVAMYLMRVLTPMSLKDIGAVLGGRDHTTIMSGVRNIERNIKTSPETAQKVKDITSNIQAKAEDDM